ncbi:hypothetical protein J4Q44_G00356680 [Coregonus suidteri]|uniref:Secreted protein n=1 Tax=Coregonus suidteri TaxID=861788 RepID=A0AAN8KIZ7_9TELE
MDLFIFLLLSCNECGNAKIAGAQKATSVLKMLLHNLWILMTLRTTWGPRAMTLCFRRLNNSQDQPLQTRLKTGSQENRRSSIKM